MHPWSKERLFGRRSGHLQARGPKWSIRRGTQIGSPRWADWHARLCPNPVQVLPLAGGGLTWNGWLGGGCVAIEQGQEIFGDDSIFDEGFFGVEILAEGSRNHRIRVQSQSISAQKPVPGLARSSQNSLGISARFAHKNHVSALGHIFVEDFDISGLEFPGRTHEDHRACVLDFF